MQLYMISINECNFFIQQFFSNAHQCEKNVKHLILNTGCNIFPTFRRSASIVKLDLFHQNGIVPVSRLVNSVPA